MKSSMLVMLTTDSNIDRRIIQEANSLESAGWQVTIIAMPKTSKLFSDDKRVIRLPFYTKIDKNNNNLFLFWFYRWLNKYLSCGSVTRTLMRKLAWLVLTDIEKFYLNMFRSTIDKYQPSVFLAHDLPTLPVAFYAASKCNAKVVYDSHELYVEQDFSNLEKRKWQELEMKYINHCNGIITINNSIAKELKERYYISDKVHIISNALPYNDKVNINSKIFHQKFDLKESSKVILFQGGLSHNRNLEKLVESMAYVQNPLINLVILGDGLLKSLLQAITVKHNITKKVHFHPAVTQEKLLSYTSCADLGVIPYQAICLNNYYCTPNKLFEFIAAEIPILSAKLPSIESILNEFQIGLVSDFTSSSQISKALDSLFKNEQILKKYQKNIKKASKKVVWESSKFTNIFENYK